MLCGLLLAAYRLNDPGFAGAMAASLRVSASMDPHRSLLVVTRLPSRFARNDYSVVVQAVGGVADG